VKVEGRKMELQKEFVFFDIMHLSLELFYKNSLLLFTLAFLSVARVFEEQSTLAVSITEA
jgi:hypothetical protein